MRIGNSHLVLAYRGGSQLFLALRIISQLFVAFRNLHRKWHHQREIKLLFNGGVPLTTFRVRQGANLKFAACLSLS